MSPLEDPFGMALLIVSAPFVVLAAVVVVAAYLRRGKP